MYYIVICDDDKEFLKYIESIILKCGLKKEQIKFYEYISGEEFIKDLDAIKYCDLLILDMQMKTLDGNDTAIRFREKYPTTTLVFCSGVYQPTVKSFETGAFRYLLKEYSDEKMLYEMKIIINKVKTLKQEPYIVGTYYNSIIRVKPEEILYISNLKHGSELFLYSEKLKVETKITSKEKLKVLYETLKNSGFVYAHNSYIVNLNYIKFATPVELELVDGTRLTIARSKEKEFRKALLQKLSEKY